VKIYDVLRELDRLEGKLVAAHTRTSLQEIRAGLDAVQGETWEQTRPGDAQAALDRLRSVERDYRRAVAAVESSG
jgi:hypothetical protein